jgi:hypothetical protein
VSARNVISGNTSDGVLIDASASGVLVEGDYLGTGGNGTQSLGNGAYGVAVFGSGNSIGGTVGTAGDVIAFNKTAGVQVNGGTGDALHHNSIFSNGPQLTGPGIVLAAGGNHSLAAPVLTGKPGYNPATHVLTVTGTITGSAGAIVTLEFYASPTGDAEGKVYLGSVTLTLKAGLNIFSVPITITNPAYSSTTTPIITAVAIASSGDTSAFSNGVHDPVIGSTASIGGSSSTAVSHVAAKRASLLWFV